MLEVRALIPFGDGVREQCVLFAKGHMDAFWDVNILYLGSEGMFMQKFIQLYKQYLCTLPHVCNDLI